MGTGTFLIVVASVLGSELIDAFGISRAQVGLLVTAFGAVGGLLSPLVGRFTDRIGAVLATRAVLIAGAVVIVGVAAAPTYAVLVVVAIATGLPNSGCNPATNLLIADNVDQGQRGLITGIKQSGVQIAAFVAGLVLPTVAAVWSWRVAVLLLVAMPLGAFGAMTRRTSKPHDDADLPSPGDGEIPVAVRWLAVYGLISGIATNSVFVYIALFAEEDQLWSPRTAGLLLSAVGLLGVISRIGWPQLSERRLGHGPTLRILSGLSLVSSIILAMAALNGVPAWLLVVAAVLLGAGSIAWNAVGMLAVMDLSPKGTVGRGTGAVLLGFLLGTALGPPLLGLSVDLLGSYTPGWIGVTILHAVTIMITFRIPKWGAASAPDRHLPADT